jgi:hypothetical protein
MISAAERFPSPRLAQLYRPNYQQIAGISTFIGYLIFN